jgi:TonB family protein
VHVRLNHNCAPCGLGAGLSFVSSAANTVTPEQEAQGNGSGVPRPNPVALEALVNVTGANTAAGDGSRHLFSEETTTVLVFNDGAVIRLAARVSVGQLIFLTNKRSNQEVICQVLRHRSSNVGSSYVELKFTEERRDYWGVAFPEGQKSAPEFKVAEQVQAEATTAQPTETPITPHSAEDVDKLKREVEALREQLAALEKKNIDEAAAKATAEAAAAREAAVRELALQNATKAVDAVAGQAPKHKEELAPVNQATPVPRPTDIAKPAPEKPTLLMPAAPKDTNEAAPPVVSMSLPVWKMEKSPEEQLLEEEAAQVAAQAIQPQEPEAGSAEVPGQQPAEDLLPKPELDFSQAQNGASKKQQANAKAANAATAGPTSGRMRIIGLAAVVALAMGGGAWYGKWWKYLATSKKAPVPVAVPHAVAPRTAPTAAKAASPTSNPPGAAASPAGKDSSKPDTASSSTTGNDGATPTKSAENESAVPEKRSVSEKAPTRKETPKVQDLSSTTEMASDAPPQPAKLVKSVNPVYPPDAMRSYITGDVKAEVTVLPSGRVGEVRVTSGPKALRDAAVEALKQYQYAPANQGGKAIESKTTEVVKFWFNP